MLRMTLDTITTNTVALPPRLVVYGPHGIGKTTFATSAPSPIVIRTEDGLGTLPVPAFPLATHYNEVIDAIGVLYRDPHPYQTVVLDSLDWLEALVWAKTAFEGGQQSIEGFGFGKGYKYADANWAEIMTGLNSLRTHRGMTVICLAHAMIKRFDAPDTEPYDRYQIKLHDRASALWQEWADVVGFAHYEVHTQNTDVGFNKKVARGVGAGTRILSVEERPAHIAKNRYQMPPDLPLSWPKFVDACTPAFARMAAAATPTVPSIPVPAAPAADPASASSPDVHVPTIEELLNEGATT